MSTLTEFLMARLDEDENHAKAQHADAERTGWGSYTARVQAEVAAKRRIVELHRYGGWEEIDGEEVPLCSCGDAEPCPTLRALASVYADHSDYQAEWAMQGAAGL